MTLPRLHAEADPRPTRAQVSPPAAEYPPVEQCHREDLLRIAARPLWEVMGSSQHVNAIMQLALVQASEQQWADGQVLELQKQLAVQQGLAASYDRALDGVRAQVERQVQLVADERAQRAEIQDQLDRADALAKQLQKTVRIEEASFRCLTVVTVTGDSYAAVDAELGRQVIAHPPVFDVSDVDLDADTVVTR